MHPPDQDADLAMSPIDWERPVGEAATDGALFRRNPGWVPGYQPHRERKRGPLLSRDGYTALPLVRVVRCAWLETFGSRCPRQQSGVVSHPHHAAGTVLSRERCKLHEGHGGACQLEAVKP